MKVFCRERRITYAASVYGTVNEKRWFNLSYPDEPLTVVPIAEPVWSTGARVGSGV